MRPPASIYSRTPLMVTNSAPAAKVLMLGSVRVHERTCSEVQSVGAAPQRVESHWDVRSLLDPLRGDLDPEALRQGCDFAALRPRGGILDDAQPAHPWEDFAKELEALARGVRRLQG